MPDNESRYRRWLFRIHRAASDERDLAGAYRIKIGVTRSLGRAIVRSLPRNQQDTERGMDPKGRSTRQIAIWGITVEWLDDGKMYG